jgi:hypothetical protein
MAPPDKLRIEYEPDEEGWFHRIGRFKDGSQFMAFVTSAFTEKDRHSLISGHWRKDKHWITMIHKFDSEGNYLASETRHGGFDIGGWDIVRKKATIELDRMLEQMEAEPRDIYIKPFTAIIKGICYELVYKKEIDEEDWEEDEYVILRPNDIMFHPPWDSGEYST